MPRVPGVKGVTYTRVRDGVWRARWREYREGGGEVSRSETFEGQEQDAIARVLRIRAALDEHRTYDPLVALEPDQPAANLIDGMSAMIQARLAAGRYAEKTARTYTSYMLRVAAHLHAIHEIPETEPLPVTLLSRHSFVEMMRRDRVLGASQQTAYASLRFALEAWDWLAEDPTAWPHVPASPKSKRDYLPRTPKYSRTVAPGIDHVDACLRHLPPRTSHTTRMLGVFMRFTGLRADTVLGLRREDLDLDQRTLFVRAEIDKGQYARPVPLADAFCDEAQEWIELTPRGEKLFKKRRHTTRRTDTPKKKPTETFKAAWEAATTAGEVPRHVWDPPNRRNARPEHGIRAAFDAFLIEKKVPADVVDYLVGRGESDIRSTHYSRDLLAAAREAVNLVPPIDWGGPEASTAGNIVSMRGQRGR